MPTHLLLGSCEEPMTALRILALGVKCVGILQDFSGGARDSMVPSSVPMSSRRFHNISRCLFREPLSCGLNEGAKRCLLTPRAGYSRLLGTLWASAQATERRSVCRLYGKRHRYIPHEASEDAGQMCGCKRCQGHGGQGHCCSPCCEMF